MLYLWVVITGYILYRNLRKLYPPSNRHKKNHKKVNEVKTEGRDHLDGFYSKEYRTHFKSSCIVEECVEEVLDEVSPDVLESEAYEQQESKAL